MLPYFPLMPSGQPILQMNRVPLEIVSSLSLVLTEQRPAKHLHNDRGSQSEGSRVPSNPENAQAYVLRLVPQLSSFYLLVTLGMTPSESFLLKKKKDRKGKEKKRKEKAVRINA